MPSCISLHSLAFCMSFIAPHFGLQLREDLPFSVWQKETTGQVWERISDFTRDRNTLSCRKQEGKPILDFTAPRGSVEHLATVFDEGIYYETVKLRVDNDGTDVTHKNHRLVPDGGDRPKGGIKMMDFYAMKSESTPDASLMCQVETYTIRCLCSTKTVARIYEIKFTSPKLLPSITIEQRTASTESTVSTVSTKPKPWKIDILNTLQNTIKCTEAELPNGKKTFTLNFVEQDEHSVLVTRLHKKEENNGEFCLGYCVSDRQVMMIRRDEQSVVGCKIVTKEMIFCECKGANDQADKSQADEIEFDIKFQ